MALSTVEARQLNDALLSAYDFHSMERMLFFELGKDLQQISPVVGDFRQIVFAVIRESERGGWTNDLVHAAHDANPGNPVLKAFTDKFLRFKGSAAALEKVIRRTNGFIDVSQWRRRLERIERQVCFIEIAGDHFGTGFLINHDLVVTNYHVIEDLLGDQPRFQPEQVRVRFDFRKSEDGTVLNDGVRYQLNNAAWLVDHTPYSANDPRDLAPAADELDYAVLRVAARELSGGGAATPGNEPIVGSADKIRGWIAVPEAAYAFTPGEALFIVQHPKDQPLKMALDTDGIEGVKFDGKRVRYRTNTEHGSSGSPCFNSNWELVALHHMGDPDWVTPGWNQGVPIARIRDHWAANQLLNVMFGDGNQPAAADTPAAAPVTVDDEVDDLLG